MDFQEGPTTLDPPTSQCGPAAAGMIPRMDDPANSSYDVIIVGGRPAGASLAARLPTIAAIEGNGRARRLMPNLMQPGEIAEIIARTIPDLTFEQAYQALIDTVEERLP